ncbi:MAG: hypothetical protein KIT16_04110 [Rhodospirillaceae bacterium]|nr:hypothetical protein [Rhodospirillaceae bacterium]
MNAKVIGGGIVVVAAVAAGLYFGVLQKSGGGPEVAKERADKVFASLKAKGGEATYANAEASGNGVVLKKVVLKSKDPSGKPMELTIDELRVKSLDWANPAQPSFADAEYRGLRFPALAENPQFKEFSSVTGLKEVVINAKVDYTYDKATKTIEFKTAEADVDGVGKLSFTGKIEGVDIAQLEGMQGTSPDPSKLMGMLGVIRLHSLRIAFKDAGGVAKLMKFGAHKEKKTEDQIRTEMLAKIAQGKNVPVKIGRDAATAAESFIKSPGTFAIEAKPKAPFALAQLMALAGKFDPPAIDKLAEELGLSVKAE